jgi:hypothetical protein
LSFNRAGFGARFATMGDPAEEIFAEVEPKHHKLGMRRPPFGLAGMPSTMRYIPDFVTRNSFVEVMGVGRDRLLKVKNEKLDALKLWSVLGPVELFVWDQHKDATFQAPLAEWVTAMTHHGERGTFSEGKSYIALHVDHFPTAPKERDALTSAAGNSH